MKPAITEIGADAEVATDHSAMDTGDGHRRERPPDSGVGLGDSGRDAVKGEGHRSEE
jgi:hypothetical protein